MSAISNPRANLIDFTDTEVSMNGINVIKELETTHENIEIAYAWSTRHFDGPAVYSPVSV